MIEQTLFPIDPAPAPVPHECKPSRCECGRFVVRSQPMLHRGDPVTSRAAAAKAADPARLTLLQRRVLANLYHADRQLQDGLTDWQHFGILQTTAGKRRLELLRAGLVANSGHEAMNPNGSMVTVWTITDDGVRVWKTL